ncbi:XRE family transcriptional regulator [Listeria monocytogenes]|uniref:helix-turn-helix transcriptional regulator n=1 Tax=Listeria monocytogenes TaxID=1639 RepID=UPI0010F14DD9|nr:helix-turn-helix transcriptional regulator [Listeria monocytogenes]EAC7181333.1 XRE family transcriptional regulator [Listeria monocytogenes]EAC8000083.1 XRE family transcriptional regulator [Listeria monocytogenes]EAF1189815.1 XRE family transcriptional regulator [Listeria monocytogenes]EAK8400092.1 XRE family transcriptional regulator [Listeria monocytogenes]EIL9238528.1 helix-turn-helix transcriptional regulator [Listeria monocytogenes]
MRKWLQEIRNANNISQNEIAKKIGVNRVTYTSYELGSRNPSVEVAKKIGKEFGFDWTLFFDS